MGYTQKTYTLPAIGGKEVTKTLGKPSPKRMAEFLDLFGVKDFNELRTPDGQLNYAMFVLETGRDAKKLISALDVCLVEGSVDVDFSDIDLRLTDEVIQDFFEQRSKTLLARMNS